MAVLQSLPAAAMDSTFFAASALKAFSSVLVGLPPPSDMLMMLAPAAPHLLTAVAKVDEYAQPSAPNTLTMCSLSCLFGLTPTTPMALLTAAMVPATCVPCWSSSVYHQPVPLSHSPVRLLPMMSS